jgi:RNA recognition motif-containing protein
LFTKADVAEEELYQFFKDSGVVKGVRVVRDKVGFCTGPSSVA